MESNLQSESRSDQSQPSPVRSPSSGSGWPLKNITKRFASRKNHEHSSEESTKRQEPVSNQSKTSVVLKKHGASRLGSKSSSGRKHSDTDVTPRTRSVVPYFLITFHLRSYFRLIFCNCSKIS